MSWRNAVCCDKRATRGSGTIHADVISVPQKIKRCEVCLAQQNLTPSARVTNRELGGSLKSLRVYMQTRIQSSIVWILWFASGRSLIAWQHCKKLQQIRHIEL